MMHGSLLRGFTSAAYALVMAAAGTVHAASCANWPAWEGFRSRFVTEDGRVIDPSTPAQHSTSEGQSYGLFFALVANDRDRFARMLRWTEDNLAGGDLTARLPAWQWGRRDDGSWAVLDDNAASDSDLWIAYVLGEAGRLWQNRRYAATAQLLADRVLREETADIAGLGRTLLPGPRGFRPQPGLYRLNPSYVPIQLMRRFAALYPQPEWRQLAATSIEMVVRSAPRGFAPDWVMVRDNSSFFPDSESNAVGSYNAIRVYLWAGMLAREEPVRAVLLKALAPAALHVAKTGTPPLETDTRAGTVSGVGPAGFSAALLPFLDAARMPALVRQQRLRIDARSPLERADNYYEQALTLFGLGWIDGHYRFARDGALLPRWTCATN